MAQRPGSGNSSGGGDGNDFGWLYGKKRDQQADDEATQVLPTSSDPSPTVRSDRVRPGQASPKSAPQASRQPYQQPQPSPAPVPQPAPGRQKRLPSLPRALRPRRPRIGRLLLILFIAWLAFLIITPFFAWTNVDKVKFEPGGERPDDQGGTTYLLVGSDSRADLTKAERQKLGTGNPAGQRTDTILLLHTGSGPNLLMSIPRDSIVEIPERGTTKINAAFAFGGPKLLTRTIESETGIRIDDYVEIGFGGFVDIVDAVNGIEICPRKRMEDKLAKLNVKKGCQEADGATALGYARSRKLANTGDIDRARRQREVISAVGAKATSPWSVINPFRYWNLNQAATQTVRFGEGANPITAARWAFAMTRVNGEAGLTCGVPIRDLAVNWDEERSEQMFAAIREDDTDSIPDSLCTGTGLPGNQ